MHRVEVKEHLDDDEVVAVQGLVRRASAHDGHEALGEHQWLDLVQGGRTGFAGLVARDPGHDHPVGYAQVTRNPQRPSDWALELVVAPHHREDTGIGSDLVGAALDVVRSSGGGHVHFWVPKPRPDHDVIAVRHGLTRGRDLYQLRRFLPVGEPHDLATRPFEPGRDEAAWLAVNNAAFAWHPEQGGWDEATLVEREASDWFDPAGFLLYEEAGQLVGFCWTKLHPATLEPAITLDGAVHTPGPVEGAALGEIYVIAVDPKWAGQGYGRRLVLAGLEFLHRERDAQIGMLYVDAGNRSAVRLYFGLGFTIDHIDRAYVVDIAG